MIELKKTIPTFDVLIEKITKAGIFFFLSGFYLMVPGKAHNNIFYLSVLLPGLILFYKKYKKTLNNKIIFYFGLCLLYFAISSLWGDSKDFLPALTYCIYITMFMWIFSYLIYSDKLYKNIILNSLPLVAAFSVVVNTIGHQLSSRLYGTVGIWECIGLGLSYSFAAIIATHNIFTSIKYYHKFFSLLILIILCTGVIFSQSRLALGSLLGGIFILVVSSPMKFKRKLLIFCLFNVLIIAIYILYPQLLRRHLLLISQIFDSASNIPRVIIWKSLLVKMEGVWVFGHGYGVALNNLTSLSSHVYVTAHNLYIGHLFLGGVTGLILTLIAIGFIGIHSFMSLLTKKNSLGLSLFVFSVLVMCGQYTYLLDHPNEVWINILIPLALCYGLSINIAEKIPNKSL